MNIGHLLTQPIMHQATATTLDGYNNVHTTPDGDPRELLGYLEWQSSTEQLNNRDTVSTNWKAFFPANVVLSAYDYLTSGGQTFQVTGNPHLVYNPRTRSFSHIEVFLVEVV